MAVSFWQLLRVGTNPRIIQPPLKMMRELNKRGIRRLPDEVYDAQKGRVKPGPFLKFVRHWLGGEKLTRHRGQWVLNSFLPPFPGKAYERLFTSMLSGRRLNPVSAYFALTSKCQAACAHCSAADRQGTDLTTAHWQKILIEAQDLGTGLIGLTGGEPLLRDDLTELIATAAEKSAVIVFTSGIGVDRTKISDLAKAGLWSLCVSLDSAEPKIHNQSRGVADAFDQAVQTLKAAKAAGLYTMTGTLVTRELLEGDRLEKLYALAAKLGIHEVRLTEPMPCGKLSDCGNETLLNPQNIAKLRDFHRAKNRRRKGPRVTAFNEIESPQLFGCGAGTQHFYVDANGEVCPCDFTPLSFGNAKTEDLEAIWLKMNQAMGDAPRRHCFIQKHHDLIAQVDETVRPLPPELSCEICKKAGTEPMPDWFQLLTAGKIENEGESL